MQFSDVKQVKQVVGAGNANTMLNEGWVLLAVVPATLNSPSGNSPSVMYVLGSSEAAEPKKPVTVSSAALARANERL